MNKLTLSSVALETYRKESKQVPNLDRDILELKLTALANNSDKLGQVGKCRVYKFCGLIMLINENHSRIETLTWRNELHKSCKVTKETAMNLKQDYRLLGLSNSGNSYLK
jgi:hypothetical protein